MKILFIIDALNSGGKERRLVELLKSLSKIDSIKIQLVILSKKVHYKEVQDLNINISFLERNYKYDPGIFIKLFKLCLKFKPDIIHSWNLMTTIYSLPIVKLLNVKFINAMIVNAPCKLPKKVKIISKIGFSFSDVIQSNSHAGLAAYKVKKRGNVIHNGFNFERIHNINPDFSILKNDRENNKVIVGMVASFNDYKDYETLIIAANKITKIKKNLLFVLVGDGINLPKMKRIANGNEKIVFTGLQKNVESIINLFDIGVLVTYTEGISNSILEYMALGKPVIATDGGGTKEIVIDGYTGFLIPQKSVDELEKKILLLSKNKNLREQMGWNGNERIKKYFSIEKMVCAHLNMYKSLIK